MKSLGIVGIVASSVGLLFSWGALSSVNDDAIGYGFFGLLLYGYFLGMSIIAVNKEKK